MSLKNPVSIVMPAYNAGRFIDQAIQSVVSQTYTEWELLIVDDCSSDSTPQIVAKWIDRDARIKVFRQTVNQGVVAARNLALSKASGRYIAFLDSDDFWEVTKLERQISFMDSQNVAVCYSGYRRVDERGLLLAEVHPALRVDYEALLRGNEIGNLTGVYDSAKLGKEFFKSFRHEDYVAWLALVKRAGEARGLPELLASYRVYGGSISSNKIKVLSWQWRIYRESEGIELVRALWLMFTYAIRAIQKRI